MPNSHRVLLIEDDIDTQMSLYELLSHEGYSVVTAGDGQLAFDLLERGIRPSLIMIDLMLPRVSGFDLIRHLRTDPELRWVPTVVITALAKEHVNVIADAVFHKPLEYQPLLASVRTLLRVH